MMIWERGSHQNSRWILRAEGKPNSYGYGLTSQGPAASLTIHNENRSYEVRLNLMEIEILIDLYEKICAAYPDQTKPQTD